MFAYSLYMSMGMMVYLQAILAITRWAAVCRHYCFSVRKIIFSSVMGCLVPSAIMFLPAVGVWGDLGYDEGTGGSVGGMAVCQVICFRNLHHYKWSWGELCIHIHPHLWTWCPLCGDHHLLHTHHMQTQEIWKQSPGSAWSRCPEK